MYQLNLLTELNKIDEQIGFLKKSKSEDISKPQNAWENGNTQELLSQLVKNREAIFNRIDERLRRAFEKLQTRYKGSALSRVVDNSCSSCNIGLSSLSLNALKNRRELTFCEHCGRILIYQ